MKKKLLLILMLAAFGTGTSCTNLQESLGLKKKKKKDDTLMYLLLAQYLGSGTAGCDATVSPQLRFSGDITSDTTWPTSTLITGVVKVKSGATLTIPARSYVYGDKGSVIYVEAGGKLVAKGTATDPICMTSSQPVGGRKAGDWGGIVMVGNAISSRTTAGTTEGAAAGIALPYGAGPNDADSSGTLQYVVVDFAGYYFQPNEELNSFSLYSIGSGTTIDHIQANMGLDDGVELWGGAASIKYLMVTGGADDDLDLDEGYTGKVQYMVGMKYPASCGMTISTDPRGFEMDGTPTGTSLATGSWRRTTNTKISNFTLIGQKAGADTGMFAREGLNATFTHGLVYNFTTDRAASVVALGEPTNVTYKDILTEAGNTANVGATGGLLTVTESNVSDTLSAMPVVSADGVACGATAPDFTPTGAAANSAPETVATAQGGDAFFTDNSTYGAVVAGDKWWTGWTTFHNK